MKTLRSLITSARWAFVRWLGALAAAAALSHAPLAAASDAGDGASDGGEADAQTAADGGTSSGDDGSPAQMGTPLACDGALCDTTNGSECGVARGSPGGGPAQLLPPAVLAAVLAFGAARRRRRGSGAVLAVLAFVLVSDLAADRSARADTPKAVDVVVRDPPPPHRSVVLAFNPLALLIGKVSADVVIAPGDHHSLVLNPFYSKATTAPIDVVDDAGNATQLPKQTFEGFGGELGYRYYFARGGPRGLFVGPSLVLASMTATAANGSRTSYLDYGLAGDVGYQVLVADSVALDLGGGLQYTTTTKTIPNQQFPAEFYANPGLRPRLLLSFGWAF
jgi:hypothetical protein